MMDLLKIKAGEVYIVAELQRKPTEWY